MIKIKGKPYLKVLVQIFLVVSLSFAYSYLTNELDKNIVSAQEIETGDVVNTCIYTKEDGVCQEYLVDECSDKCDSDCLPATLDNVPECELGVCYDEDSGFCFPNSPKQKCEDDGGVFFDDGNTAECRVGCCQIGGNTEMTTERECEKIEDNLQIETEFMTDLSQGECFELGQNQVVGACIFTSVSGDSTCRLKSRLSCYSQNGLFYQNMLCTHPGLGMDYEKMHHTGCAPGRDEIYWFDDQGNRENIYEGSTDSQKESSWNDGIIKSKEDSCVLGTEDNPLENQETCGNCDRFASTICASKTSDEKLLDDDQDVVCKSLYCYDEINSEPRENGETWCYYEGHVLPTEDRATATPGSRHFVMQCLNGEISISKNCADYRDTICMENIMEREDETTRSVASCQANNFYECLVYNTEDDLDEAMEKCEANPLCFVKSVNLPDYERGDDKDDTDFKFDVCAAKYPGGTGGDFEDYDYVCEAADIECPMAKVKTLDDDLVGHHYEWVNRGCTRNEFVKQLNDLCISLGDCGASVNYIGDYSKNFEVTGGPGEQRRDLPDNYISEIKEYNGTILGDFIQFETALFDNLDGGENDPFGDADNLDNSFPPGPEAADIAGLDIPFLGQIMNNPKTWGTYALLAWVGLSNIPSPSLLSWDWWKSLVGIDGFWTKFSNFMTPVVTTIVGASLVSWLMQDLEIAAGLSDEMASALVLAGGTGGLLVGLQIIGVGGSWQWTSVGAIGIYIIIAVIVIEYLLESWGIGEVTEYTASFDCEPWTPLQGGENCHKCTESDFPCTDYACWSLGTTCKLVNEGTFAEECAHVPTLPGGPIISPLYSAEIDGKTEYTNAQPGIGYEVKSLDTDEDGCFLENDYLEIGINLSEAGRCTYSVTESVVDSLNFSGYLDYLLETEGRTEVIDTQDIIADLSDYDEFYFGGNNMYFYEHVQPITAPSFSSISEDYAYVPDKKTYFEMIIYCEDLEGNKSETDYSVQFCVKSGNRTFAPEVLVSTPANGLLKNDVVDAEFSVYTNAPSECKWSTGDKEYEEMENEFECKNNPNNLTHIVPLYRFGESGSGFECSSNTSMESVDNKTIYVRCKDQPWYSEDDPARNVMTSSYVIDLTRTNALEITSLEMNNVNVTAPGVVLRFGTEPAEVTLGIDTAGGADSGKATCYYLAGSGYSVMAETGETHHERTFDQYVEGKYKSYVYCEDYIGNIARGESEEFRVEIDKDAPDVVKAFAEMGSLKVITNEPAACYYSNKDCYFEMSGDDEDAKLMTVGTSTEHSTTIEYGKTYYLRCKDEWERYDAGCSRIIKTLSF